MNIRQKFFSSGVYNISIPNVPLSSEESDLTALINQEEASVVCPVSEHGYVSDVLSRALNSDISPSERDYYLSMLESIPSSPSMMNVPDEVKLNLCKLRTCQSPSEMRSYIDALSAWIDSNNVSSPVEDKNPSVDSPSIDDHSQPSSNDSE